LWGLIVNRDIEIEIVVFGQFRDSAVELGLQNAALVLTEQIAARKQALIKVDLQPSKILSSRS
jgi:hypothetical protein